jgi:hypothetical protein
VFDVSVLDLPPPEAAGEPACRSCTILLEPARPGREAIELPGGLGKLCDVCYQAMSRHMANGLSMPAALAVTTWGTFEV